MKSSVLLSDNELHQELKSLPGWAVEGNKLRKEFKFKDFKAAFEFIKLLADYAEQINHHPDLFNSYNIVSLTLSTHHVGGITSGDTDLAHAAEKFSQQTLE
jgi:4a-hydroxytetrahydrobiopterin dehydratase